MNNSVINSLVTMHALQQKIDNISNNLANINTVGYKSREVYFSDILSSRMNQPDTFQLEGRMTPIGLHMGYGAQLSSNSGDFGQGQMIATGIATDMMLSGENIFFTIVPANQDPADPKNLRYTRDGHFQIDANGNLVTANGDYVLNTDEERIYIPEGASFTIDQQGRIYAMNGDGTSEEIGALLVTKVNTPQALEQVGNNQYRIPEEFVNNQNLASIDEAFTLLENNNNMYSVVQGSLEGSNVDLAKEMVQLNEAQRAYQFMSKGLSIADQMMGIANSIRG